MESEYFRTQTETTDNSRSQQNPAPSISANAVEKGLLSQGGSGCEVEGSSNASVCSHHFLSNQRRVCEHSACCEAVSHRQQEMGNGTRLSPHLQPQTGTKCDLNGPRNPPLNTISPPQLENYHPCQNFNYLQQLTTGFLPSPTTTDEPQAKLEILR